MKLSDDEIRSYLSDGERAIKQYRIPVFARAYKIIRQLMEERDKANEIIGDLQRKSAQRGIELENLRIERDSAIKLADWNKDCATMALGELQAAEEERDRYRSLLKNVTDRMADSFKGTSFYDEAKQALGEDDGNEWS